MDPLLKTALVGTGKAADDPLLDAPAATLARAASPDDREHRLLMQAGAEATYAIAGYEPAANLPAPDPAEPDNAPPCPPLTERLLHGMLAGEMTELLPELLGRMTHAGLLLPPAALPQALGVGDDALRRALRPTLGHRGRWLSRFNPAWAWAETPTAADWADDPEALRNAWDEGEVAARADALAAMRRLNHAEARQWLEDAWKVEKADNRARFLESLETGLSLEDEPFLEAALDDRSAAVRLGAMALLAILPNSQYSKRVLARAEAILQTGQSGWLRKRPRLECVVPEQLDKEAARDIVEKPPQGARPKSLAALASLSDTQPSKGWWTLQTLSAVPPAHWEQRMGLKPAELVALAETDGYAGASVIEGWTLAALRFAETSQAWLSAFWDYWDRAYTNQTNPGFTRSASDTLQLILNALAQPEAEAKLLPRIQAVVRKDGAAYAGFAETIPAPWSAAFARGYLRALRAGFKSHLNQNSFTWARSLPAAGRALPQECFDEALEEWEVSDKIPWQGICQREIGRMQDIVRARKIYFEEIPL